MLYMTPPPATTTGHSAMSGMNSFDTAVQSISSSITAAASAEVPAATAPLVRASARYPRSPPSWKEHGMRTKGGKQGGGTPYMIKACAKIARPSFDVIFFASAKLEVEKLGNLIEK